MSVHIEPAPAWILEYVEKFGGFAFINRPNWIFEASRQVFDETKKHFVATRPPQDDIELAYAFWRELDPISQRWYVTAVGRGGEFLPLTEADLQACGAQPEEIARFRDRAEALRG